MDGARLSQPTDPTGAIDVGRRTKRNVLVVRSYRFHQDEATGQDIEPVEKSVNQKLQRAEHSLHQSCNPPIQLEPVTKSANQKECQIGVTALKYSVAVNQKFRREATGQDIEPVKK